MNPHGGRCLLFSFCLANPAVRRAKIILTFELARHNNQCDCFVITHQREWKVNRMRSCARQLRWGFQTWTEERYEERKASLPANRLYRTAAVEHQTFLLGQRKVGKDSARKDAASKLSRRPSRLVGPGGPVISEVRRAAFDSNQRRSIRAVVTGQRQRRDRRFRGMPAPDCNKPLRRSGGCARPPGRP